MKFLVKRTSRYFSDDPGVPGSVKEGDNYYLVVPDIATLFAMVGPNTDPKRRVHYGWTTQSVILTTHHTTNEPMIEIYDDWRE